MGRIKTTWMKNIARELLNKYPDKFTGDFENNKKFLESLKIIEDKTVRNKVAGYLTRTSSRK